MKTEYIKYPEYKNSDFGHIGKIPKAWNTKRFKFCLSELLMYGANEAAQSSDPSQPRFVRITDVDKNGNLKEETFKSLDEEVAKPYLLKEGDLLMARSGATVGKSFMYQENWGIACFAGYLIRARLNFDVLIPSFGNYFLNSSSYWGWVNSIFIQATIQNISAEKYANLGIAIPSITEQTQIAKFLDQKTGQIDRLIAKKEKLLLLLAEKRTAIITQAVTKGLDPSVEMKDSGIDWLGEIPKHWEMKKIKHISLKVGDGLHGTPEYTDNTEYYFINGNNLGNGCITITPQTKTISEEQYLANDKNLDSQTLLLSINGTIGNVAFYKGESVMLGKSAAYIKFQESINIKYLRWYLESSIFVNYFELELTGTTIKNLSLESIKNTPVIFPKDNEQDAIISYIETITEKLDKTLNSITISITQLKEYREAIITAAVTGQIKVAKPDESHEL